MKKTMSTLERTARICPVLLFAVTLIVSAAFPTGIRALTVIVGIVVNSTADNTTADGACTLREAITNADNDAATYSDCSAGSGADEINFDSSLGTVTIALTSTLPTITDGDSLAIYGDNRITISGSDNVRVLDVKGGNLGLYDISVTHGKAAGGGGMYVRGSSAAVDIYNSIFSDNNATASNGGGVFIEEGALTVSHSTFSNNSAGSDGGGIAVWTTLTVANSTFSGNSANYGGGVATNSGTVTIANSTFSDNTAVAHGGAVSIWKGGTTPPNTTIYNTILANSSAPDDCYSGTSEGILNGSNNIIEATSTCTTIATITSDPNLSGLSGYYFPLNLGSPAIDAGDNATCAADPVNNLSQNDLTRPQDGNGDGIAVCDIGSYEALVLTATATLTSTGSKDGWVLESSETSSKGGSINATSGTLRLGDDKAKKQYRSILSFATGSELPDDAVITKVTLKVRKQGIIGGGNPVTTFKGFMVDIKKGTFGASALQTADFQTAASKTYGPFKPALSSNWYSIDLTGGKNYINKLSTASGLTQIRLRFKLDDNNNAVANYLSLYSGNASSSVRPQLIIEYYYAP